MDKLHEIEPIGSAMAAPAVEAASASADRIVSSPSGALSPRGVLSPRRRPLSRADKLAARIARVVRRRTSGAIVDLTVEIRRDGVHLGGRCATFYSKQLAQQAAMDVAEDEPLTNAIEVA